ncbi:hypothetical protein BT96DRAFT_378382 [Gymnopus androsaceus JB14]|uniref:Zn(2)-C6 fungal-type domain-containing protein n=1 Tax=Gymnopus androsaceus JB14 TaxID=1447944 RepID=A0A6A4IJ27_9AGAR|nr:hypothetical protein BT96DRAFT_378382 [Gymnopus androsaceus JB14]
MSQHFQSEGMSYGFSQPASYPSAQSRFENDAYGHSVDSENEDADPQGPPKKKRRRQALSCTECKRRKIKCDRNQPCAPCTRRGEQSKCQWHVVEPVEKYVSRAEYDELKSRFEHLETIVQRLVSTNSGAIGPSGSAGGHLLPSGPGSSSPLSPAVAGTAQQITGVPGPNIHGPSSGQGIMGDEPVLLSSSSQNIATRHLSSVAHLQSPPPQMMPPPHFPQALQHRSVAIDESTSTHHHHQVQGPSGRFKLSSELIPCHYVLNLSSLTPGPTSTSMPVHSSHRSRTHTRESSRSSMGSIASHGSTSKRSPVVPHSASGMAAASSPVLQYRSIPHLSPSVTTTGSAAKNSPFSLASITSPFDGEPGLGRSSGVPTEASTSTTPSSSLGQSKFTTSPSLNQSKNFQAQTLKLGERLRHLPLATPFLHSPCTSPLITNHTLPMLLIRLTHLLLLLPVCLIAVDPSGLKWIVLKPLMAACQHQEGLAILLTPTLHPHLRHRSRKRCPFKARLPIRTNVESLRAWNLTPPL